MFDYDELTTDSLLSPDGLWAWLDSFWREETELTTADLLKYQSWANLIMFLNINAKYLHIQDARIVPNVENFWRQPWFPIVLFQDRLSEQDTVTYGSGFDYDSPPDILYGQQTGDVQYVYPLPQELLFVADIPEFVDSITDSKVVIDPTEFIYDKDTGRITFSVNPFDLIESKTSADEGREYIVLWVRNLLADINVPFDLVGWVVKFNNTVRDSYAEGLRYIWELVLQGPSRARFEEGFTRASGFPAAVQAEIIRAVTSDGYQNIVSTDQNTYKMVAAQATPILAQGDDVYEGQPLSDGILFYEYPDILSAGSSELPGLTLRVPLSTGEIALLSFANVNTDWEFEAGRPSEWRFPIGGAPADVEQFWVDVDTYATANGIVFATLYGLPAAVNPMHRVIEDLMHNNIYVASVDLSEVPQSPGTFAARARELLPGFTLIVVHQNVDSTSDEIDLGVATSETITYGYNAAVPTETISVPGSGSDLEYTDHVPLVVTS